MDEPNILIKSALSEAVQKINGGMSPTAALKKVASDFDLNPNYIQRTGEALNVALHYKHFKTASDRSDEFEIADIPKAIEEVFTVNEKTASEYITETFGNNDANETVFNYNRALSNPIYKRAFLEVVGATETNDSYPTTFKTVYEKSANYINKLEKSAEAAEVAKVAAEIELNDTFSTLSDSFRKDASYRSAFEEFESQVFAKHGEAAVPYIDLLHKTACPNDERGVHDDKYMMFSQSKEAQLFDRLMTAAATLVEAEKTAEINAEDLAYEKAFLKECHQMLGKQAEEEKEEASEKDEVEEKGETEEKGEAEGKEEEDPVLEQIKKKVLNPDEKQAAALSEDPVLEQAMEKDAFLGGAIRAGAGLLNTGSFGKMLAGPLAELVGDPVTEAFHHNFKSPAKAVKPNLTLDNMERRLLLQELMLTDPILSKVNPAKVARAFEQLLRLSPEISKQKEVVRAELRAMVSSQALSKFDADLLAKTDLGMLKRRVATQQYNMGMSDNFRM
jgi:hypothetical protein